MKLNILIIIILIIIISLSIFSYNLTVNKINKLQNHLKNIKKTMNEDNWDKTTEIHLKLEEDWEKNKKLFALIIDHEAIHNLEISLSKLEAYLHLKNTEKCLVEINLSRRLLIDMKNQEKLSLENVF